MVCICIQINIPADELDERLEVLELLLVPLEEPLLLLLLLEERLALLFTATLSSLYNFSESTPFLAAEQNNIPMSS